jgi:hypothetical protein
MRQILFQSRVGFQYILSSSIFWILCSQLLIALLIGSYLSQSSYTKTTETYFHSALSYALLIAVLTLSPLIGRILQPAQVEALEIQSPAKLVYFWIGRLSAVVLMNIAIVCIFFVLTLFLWPFEARTPALAPAIKSSLLLLLDLAWISSVAILASSLFRSSTAIVLSIMLSIAILLMPYLNFYLFFDPMWAKQNLGAIQRYITNFSNLAALEVLHLAFDETNWNRFLGPLRLSFGLSLLCLGLSWIGFRYRALQSLKA